LKDRSIVNQRGGDMALIVALLAVSGNPAFSGPAVAPWILLSIFIAVMIARQGQLSIDFLVRFGLISTGFLFVFVAHQSQFGTVSVAGSIYFLIKMFIGGLVLSHLDHRLPDRLFRAVFWLSISSLILQSALLAVGPDDMPGFAGADWLGENLKTLLIFTIHETPEWWRNSSMMWEPGAFQGLINLSLMLLPAPVWMARPNRKKMMIVVIALISTFSTTGYLVFFLIAIFKLSRFRVSTTIKTPLIALLIGTAALAIVEAEFLGQKIAQQIESTETLEDFAPDRFSAMLFDLHYIEKFPLFGNGLIEDTRLADHPHLHGIDLGHGNGLSNFIAGFGIFGLALYLGGILTSRISDTWVQRAGMIIVVVLLVFGEQFLGYSMFLGLPFVNVSPKHFRTSNRTPITPGLTSRSA
jgi:hypothetical protein